MRPTRPTPAQRGPRRGAFSLIEVLVATGIMGVLLVAAMQTVGHSVRAEQSNAETCHGLWLAEQLMAEVLAARYGEPDDAATFGLDASEITGTRSAFDDVDDYNNWTASPPQDRDGTEIPDRSRWQRTVVVEYVSPDDLSTTLLSDHGIKRITVTVRRSGTTVANATAYRTDTD
jgi:prepilin-type N-terminal cleavage/methylation domain-containing protein